MLIKVAKHTIILGGDWLLPADKAEAKKQLVEHKDCHFVDKRIGGDRVLGFFRPPKGASGKLHSGVLACSMAYTNAMIAQRLSDEAVWVAAIRDGIPLSQHDIVCTEGGAQQMITDILSFNPGASIIGNWPGAVKSLEEALTDLTPKQWAESRVNPPRARAVIRKVFLALIIAAVAVAGVISYTSYQMLMKNRTLEQSRQSLMQSKEEKEKEQARLESAWLVDIGKSIERQREDFRKGVRPSDAMSALRTIVAQSALPRNGWSASKIECEVGAQSCTINWVPWARAEGSGGSPAYAAHLPEAPADIAQLTKGTVLTSAAIDLQPSLLSLASKEDALRVASFQSRFGSERGSVQFMQQNTEVKATLPSPPPGLEKATNAPSPPVLGYITEWQGTFPLHTASAAANYLSQSGVRVKKVMIMMSDNDATVSMTGQVLLSLAKQGD
ncbi:MAG: type 4b pilus protein PilO2 [Rhodocyclaceae bacterium]|nr:type 4b pilus protein PilO2 [Opitutaceae bacterium]MCL4682874.1 type 4b pilus protein PilO2 [Rhodocyclaceae bacterium]